MDPLRTYDYLALARSRLFEKIRPLGPEPWLRLFPIGPGSIAKTLTHTMMSERYYMQRLTGRAVPPYEQWPIREESPPSFVVLEAAWNEQAVSTRAALAAVPCWDEPLVYTVTNDRGGREEVGATVTDIFTQLALHEVHHRAQVMNMLRGLGVELGDLDFNTLMYTRRPATA